MNSRLTAYTAALFAVFLMTATTSAHHSYAQYDRCESLTIVGKIDRISWGNPHIAMTIDANDSNEYRIEWFNLQQLQRARLKVDVLATGDQVVITGTRNRDPELKIMALLTEIRRPEDGWAWSRTRERAADCSD